MDLTGIGGIWPASLTPFAPDGRIDEAALAAHLAQLAGVPGVRALVVNGHAGEATSLDAAERALVIRAARNTAGDTVGVVAGIVAEDTRGACALARDAAAAGADALLLFPPLLFANGAEARPEMALAFVKEVAAATPLPIVLFQLSRASGLGYATPLLARLVAEVPQIIAVKEGSDIPAVYEDNLRALRECDRPVTVLTTNNGWLFASLSYGADGILSGIGSVASDILAEMFAASQAGDIAAARAANDRLLPLARVFYRRPGLDMHNRMKTALHLLGRLPHPDPRPPLLPITAAEREEIRAALVAAGLLAA
ncbi:dihydrodipicolinate synthase family protein [Roseomonas sp. USHLN139]|uniref:dihydrodipicolinate synthase family protein n=1 Tax=Roseomonas sp. USHLN139 TaxID=3081298 RepID=UPI003B015578